MKIKNKILKNVIVFSFVAIIFSSCVPSKPAYKEEVMPPDRLIKKIEANRRKIKTFEGSGVMNIKSPKITAKAHFEVLLKKPDSIKFSIYGPFGIDLAEALISNEEFIFYDAIRNTVHKGRTDNRLLQKIFHINLSFSELIDAFAGAINLTDKLRLEPDNYKVEGNEYILSYMDSTSAKESIYEIQVDNLAIKNYKLYSEKGQMIFEGKYSNFKNYERVAIPLKTVVENRSKNQKVVISYRSVSVNDELPGMKLEIPTDAKIIEW